MKDFQKPITISQTPPLVGQIAVSMDKNDFDGAIIKQGYNLYWDRAIPCPCKSKGVNNHLSTCRNCGSTGWVFVNRTVIKGILYSMQWEFSQKEWGAENIGDIYITVRDEDKVSFMDRITVRDAETIHKQIIYPFIHKQQLIAFTIYNILQITDIFMFDRDDQPLCRLIEGMDYTITKDTYTERNKGNTLIDNTIIFSAALMQKALNSRLQMAITYTHSPQYHIAHLQRDSMVAVQSSGISTRMPISAVGRRAHYVLDAENFIGDRLNDNSYSI